MTNAEMREFWNGSGGQKWVYYQDMLNTSLTHFGHEAMAAAVVSANERVLDIGCGFGDTSLEIGLRVGRNGCVHGVDISDLIMRHAQGRIASATYQNVNFECADAQTHRFEPMSFDTVFSRFGVMFFDAPVVAFTNIRQALVADGRMAFICWQPVVDNQWVKLPLDVAGNHVSLPSEQDDEAPGAFSFGDVGRVAHILDAAGFSDISIKSYHASFNVGADIDNAVDFLSHIGPASNAIWAEDIEESTRIQFISELCDSLMPYQSAQGVILDAATWVVTARNC